MWLLWGSRCHVRAPSIPAPQAGGRLALTVAARFLPGVAGHGHKHWGSEYTHRAVVVRVLALCMMAAAIGVAIYSAVYFKIRGEMLL